MRSSLVPVGKVSLPKRETPMNNCFDLLGLVPRASIDDELLEKAYLETAKTIHPDHSDADSDRTSALNAAVSVLRSPSRRLKHLMELNSDFQWRAIPLEPELMELFAGLSRELDAAAKVTEKRKLASSALSKALLSAEILKVRESLEDINLAISTRMDSYLKLLPTLDNRLALGDYTAWNTLQQIQAKLAYLEKWQSQIRDRLLQLII